MNADLTFLHARVTPRCDARVDKYFEGYCTLQFIRRGAVELFYGQSRRVVKAPAFWTCYPGPHIRFHVHSGTTWHHAYCAMRGPGVVRLRQRGLFFEGVQACPVSEARRCGEVMDRIIELSHQPGDHAAWRAANLLEGLLLDLAERRRGRRRTEPWLEEVVEALEAGGETHPEYEEIARRAGMALSTLRRRFREETGTSLHRYVLELRLARARELAGNTELPFKEIAAQLGYDNPFYFSRQFHRFHGAPPGAYRRSRQQ